MRAGMLGDLTAVLAELAAAQSLLYQLIRRDVRIRYKQAVLGCVWGLLMPALIVLGGLVARAAMTQSASTMTEGVAAVIVKSIPWAFFVASVAFATNSLGNNLNVVTKIYFPRVALPISAVAAHAIDAAVASIVGGLVLAFIGPTPTLALLWVPILVVLILLFTTATAVFCSCLNVFFRDVKYLVQVGLMFGIFFTPVFFDTSMFGATGAQLMMFNPLAPLLEGLRLAVVQGHNLALPLTTQTGQSFEVWSPWLLVYSSIWCVGGVTGALIAFRRLEFLFAEYI
jgi:ABC-type polysaccharide/polyol phosphate export permease